MLHDPGIHFSCPLELLHQTWFPTFEWIPKDISDIQNLQDVVQLIKQQTRRLKVFATVAWFIWSRGNKLRLHESSLALDKIFRAACNYHSEFQQKCLLHIVQPSSKSVRLIPPLGDTYKTNFDGTIFADTNEASLGVVVRNANGEVIVAMSKKIPCPYSVEVLEVLA